MDEIPIEVESVAASVVDACLKIHRALGPGLLESTYQACLAHEMRSRGLRVECQVLLPVRYGAITVDAGYRIDMLIEDVVIVANKAAKAILPITKRSC